MLNQSRGKSILRQTRDDAHRINSMTVKVTEVSGRVLVSGTGELNVDVNFPVWFCERPIFTFGGELDENHSPLATLFPTISAVVINWEKKKEVEGVVDGYYIGASVAVVTTGRSGQALWLHWTVKGKALTNPTNTLEDTI